jgi:hypothetical protein
LQKERENARNAENAAETVNSWIRKQSCAEFIKIDHGIVTGISL